MTYNQPFYVPIGKGEVNLHTGIRGGYYLPALESDEEEEPQEKIIVRGLTAQERDEFNQMKAYMKFIDNKTNEFIDKQKKKRDEAPF